MAKQDIEILACRKCGAPVEIDNANQDLAKPIKCLFCGSVYTLRERQDDAQKLKKELVEWLEKTIVVSGQGGIDAHSRHLIFNQSLYPALKTDIDRHLENLESFLTEAPLVQLEAIKGLSDHQPGPFLVAISQGDNQRLKTLSARLSAQQLQDFAVLPTDKLKLKRLQLRLQSLIYYTNIVRHSALARPTVDSYKSVLQNVVALQKDYREYAQAIVDDAGYYSYLMALEARMSGGILLLEVLISALYKGHGIAPEAALSRLGRAIAQLQRAQQRAFDCTYSPRYTVSLRMGLEKDLMVARILEAVIKCYELVTRTQPVEFEPFYEHLMSYISSFAQLQTAEQLLWHITSVGRFLMARSGDAPVPVLMDWDWLNSAIESHRRKSFLGLGGEKSQVMFRHFHPYWAAHVNYTETSGLLDKKGRAHEGFILVDATSPGRPIGVHLLVNDPSLPALQTSLNNFNFLDKYVVSLPALLTCDMAEEAVKAYAKQQVPELNVTNVTMIHVVYLPVASIRYTSKKQKRTMLVSCLHAINQNLNTMLKQTQLFLQKYGV